LKDGAVVAPHRPRPDIVALALVLLVFGGIAWIAGSKYTVEGWVIGLNLFATWLGIDSAMPTPRGVLLLFLIVGVGLVYSLVDLLVWRASARRQPVFWADWGLIVLTDVVTTMIGVRAPAPGTPGVLRQVAELLPLALVWTGILTFAPEWLIIGGLSLRRM